FLPRVVLGPLYPRLERKHRLRLPLALLIAGLLAVELATLSRSGLLGLGAGFLVLLIPYRRLLISRAMLVPLGLVAALVAYELHRRPHYFQTVIASRIQSSRRSQHSPFNA